MSNHTRSSPLPACFRPNSAAAAANDDHSTAEAPPPITGHPNLSTCVYHTDIGLFSLTWSRTVLGRSLHLHLLLDNPSAAAADDDTATTLSPSSCSDAPYFHLHIKPFFFWKKHGSKKLNINTTATTSKTIQIFWDLSRAKFGSTHPEPQSGYYIAVVVAGKITLLAGDSPEAAYAKTRAKKPEGAQVMFLRREHVYGNKLYGTKASFGGRIRDISIDCRVGSSEEDPGLCFSVDQKRVLQVKHLKWKFRGNERIEVDGVYIQVYWDMYNWLFDNDEDGFALFMFRFEKSGFDDDHRGEEEDDEHLNGNYKSNNGGMVFWSQQSCGFGFEKKRKKKSLLRSARSSSSSSLSSASSSGRSSVMEWASMEENDLKSPSEFSLLVYAWKS